jgi:hypothetical protein
MGVTAIIAVVVLAAVVIVGAAVAALVYFLTRDKNGKEMGED